ncbi:MAG: M4 family metallopeptidase [Candidatus Eremiobacteraeota bacterium]|nr:M4 family metallopeptidase [Candidatus Eremiobacteraeota bacterium]
MSVVPPYLLEALERHPSERVRTAAQRTRSARVPHEQPTRPAARIAVHRPHPKHRLIYDDRHEQVLPGVLVRSEAEPSSGDGDVDRAYDMAGETLDFYAAVFGRDSIDDRGMHVISTVHYGERYLNAFWDGAQMVYGDGDGEVFASFTTCLDITAHELTHGVTQADVGFVYDGETAVLCESIADVFGSLVKQRMLGQTADEADWVLGSGIYGSGIKGVGLRSMASPGSAYDDPLLGGRDPQVAHMRDYVELGTTERTAHRNCGIPNHAFYLFAKAVGGNAWDVAGHVWYDALRSGLHRACEFRGFALATAEAARSHGAPVVEALHHAWRSVGVSVPQRAASAG